MRKIKVIGITNRGVWDKVIMHAINLGASSRDGQYTYRADKPAMVIEDYYIKYGRDKHKAIGTQPTKVSVTDFMSWDSLETQVARGTPPRAAAQPTVNTAAVRQEGYNSGFADGHNRGYQSGYTDGTADAAGPDSLKVTAVEVLDQNPMIFKTQGIGWLTANGLDIVDHEGTPYILDTVKNDSAEVTPAFIAAKAKAYIMDEDESDLAGVCYDYAEHFHLIGSITKTKVVD